MSCKSWNNESCQNSLTVPFYLQNVWSIYNPEKNETSILSVVKTYISFRNIKPFTTCFIANTHFYTQKFLFEAINCCKNVYAPYAHYAVTEDTEISFSMMKHDTQTRNPTTLCLQIDLFTEPLQKSTLDKTLLLRGWECSLEVELTLSTQAFGFTHWYLQKTPQNLLPKD